MDVEYRLLCEVFLIQVIIIIIIIIIITNELVLLQVFVINVTRLEIAAVHCPTEISCIR